MSSDESAILSILAVNIDYVLQKVLVDSNLKCIPTPILRPVIRIFGSTDVGQSACMNIHGVYPYIYFRPEVPNHPAFDSPQKVERLLPILENSLEEILHAKKKSVAASYSNNNQYVSKRKHICRLEVVAKIPIYGMWMDQSLFVKVTLYDPRDVTRLAAVLDDGSLAGIQMQTYESHIPYLLQFTSTFNISPMGWIHLSNLKFRPPLPAGIPNGEIDIKNADIKGISRSESVMKGENLEEDFKTPNSVYSQQLNSGMQSKLLHQQTPLKQHLINASNTNTGNIWTREELGLPPETTQAVTVEVKYLQEQKLSDAEQLELQSLLAGLSSHDFQFSQKAEQQIPTEQHTVISTSNSRSNVDTISTAVNLPPPVTSIPPANVKKAAKRVNPVEKVSTCDLEFDVHITHILNAGMPKKEFGAELWEEERLRCNSKGIEMDKAPTPPSTQTVHRPPSENESEFLQRFANLQMKGVALKKQAQLKYQELQQSKTRIVPKHAQDILLSQFIQHDHPITELPQPAPIHSSSFNELHSSIYFDPDSWAEETIENTIKDAEFQEELVTSFFHQSDSIVDEYVRTQSSQPTAPVGVPSSSTIKASAMKVGIVNASADDDEEEEDENGDVSQQEVADILQSTQYDQQEMVGDKHVAKNNTVAEGLRTDKEGIAMLSYKDENFMDEAVNLVDGSPLVSAEKTLFSTYDSPADTHISKDNDEKEWKNPVLSMTANNMSSSLPPMSGHNSQIRRLRLNDRQNLLSSVFKKRKREDIASQESQQHVQSSPPVNTATTLFESPTMLSPILKHGSKVKDMNDSAGDYSSTKKKLKRKSVSFAFLSGYSPADTADQSINTRRNLWSSDEDGLDRITSVSEANSDKVSSSKIFSNKEGTTIRTDTSENIRASLRLVPTFQPPSFKTVAEMGLDSEDLLPHRINTPAFFSKLKDARQHQQSAQVAQHNLDYHAYMMDRHDVKHVADVDSFFSTSQYQNSPLSPAARVRCLLPTFAPPILKSSPDQQGSSFESSLPTAVGKSSTAKKEARTSWFKSQIATPTQTPGSVPSNNSADSAGKTKLGMGNKSKEKMTRLITLSMELFCCTRKELLPNPKYDAVQVLVWCATDVMNNAESEIIHRFHGIITWIPPMLMDNRQQGTRNQSTSSSTTVSAASASENLKRLQDQWRVNITACPLLPPDIQVNVVEREHDLYDRFFTITKEIDPDFIVGYENQNSSFGYLMKRGVVIGKDVLRNLSRLPNEKPSFRNAPMYIISTPNNKSYDNNGKQTTQQQASSRLDVANDIEHEKDDFFEQEGVDSETLPAVTVEGGAGQQDDMVDEGDPGIFIKGRTLLNNWQLMKMELKLSNSTIQYVTEEVLKASFPFFSHAQLTRWFNSPTQRHRTIQHIYMLASLNILLLEKLDLIRKISESARLYGIDFYSVIHRGSQYRVEAALLNRARSMNFILLSPSRQKVANQSPMEVIPLVMEPQSRFYHDPVLVLDFQSLYPSMMIAHNLCFSTCMGKLRPGVSGESDTTGKLGVIAYPEKLSALHSIHHLNHAMNMSDKATDAENAPYVSPNGSVFCSKNIRKGILPLMLQEMLNTRVMVKRAMKRHAGNHANSVLSKVLDARQLAIKLLSNVTYGYTAAGFSGRMPMAELADAIVQSGRSLLEWSMERIRTHPQWKAEVVYGDTDSVFVHLPGRSLAQAFQIGEEIARDITSKTPEDVVLKFEKVYFPCILVTKKRYVGNCYEHVDQKDAHLDAKGIEVIRRDQCPAAQKIQEKVLRLLFTTRDMSLVKQYLYSQWTKMLMGSDKLLIRDFIFCKEVRFGHYASVSSQPPGAIVATKAVLLDEMAVPPYNWRVPYVVVHGLPNALLKQLVYDPKDVLRRGSNLRVNYIYYITKCINPALDRVLSLCGVSVFQWYRTLVRPKPRIRHINYDMYDNAVHTVDASEVDGSGMVSIGKSGMHRYRQHQQQSSVSAHMAATAATRKRHQTTMDQFTMQATCEICGLDALPQKNLCQQCLNNQMNSLILLTQRLTVAQSQDQDYALVCHACTGFIQGAQLFAKGEMIASDACQALECAVFHERARLVTRMEDFTLAMRDVSEQTTDLSIST